MSVHEPTLLSLVFSKQCFNSNLMGYFWEISGGILYSILKMAVSVDIVVYWEGKGVQCESE